MRGIQNVAQGLRSSLNMTLLMPVCISVGRGVLGWLSTVLEQCSLGSMSEDLKEEGVTAGSRSLPLGPAVAGADGQGTIGGLDSQKAFAGHSIGPGLLTEPVSRKK